MTAPRLTMGAALVVTRAICKMLLSLDPGYCPSDNDAALATRWIEAHRGAKGTTIAVAARMLTEVAAELAAIHARSLS